MQARIFQYTEAGHTPHRRPVQAARGWQRTGGSPSSSSTTIPASASASLQEAPVDQWDPDAWREVTRRWERGPRPGFSSGSTSQAHREFEVVANIGIPVRGLFIFMILFVVLIGPINFYWLTQTRRRIWLLWTVPVFSLITCAILFGYMLVSEGWRGHYRAASVTVLDEATQHSTVGWLGYYTPTTPSSSLHFSDDTEFTPHLLQDRYLGHQQSRTADQLDQQPPAPRHWLARRQGAALSHGPPQRARNASSPAPRRTAASRSSTPSKRGDEALPGRTGRQDLEGGQPRPGPEVKLQPTDLVAASKDGTLRDGFGKTWINLLDEIAKKPADFCGRLLPGHHRQRVPVLEQGLQHVQSRRRRPSTAS